MVKELAMVKIDNFEIKARDALLNSLQDIPFLQVMGANLQPEYGRDETDLRVTLNLNGEYLNIIAEIKRNGELRYARQAVNQLIRYLQNSPALAHRDAHWESWSMASWCTRMGSGCQILNTAYLIHPHRYFM